MGNRRFRGVAGLPDDEELAGVAHDGRLVFRKVLDFGALPNASGRAIVHGISDLNEVVGIEGVAVDTATGDTIAIGD